MFKPIITRLSGVSFGDTQKNIKQFGCEDIGSFVLIREPDNLHDPCAIRVSLFDIWFMGYVPKNIAKDLAPMMDAGREFDVEFVCRNEYPPHERVGLTVRIVEK